MNRDVDGGKSLEKQFLASLYFSIQTEPFKIPPEDGNDLMLTFFNPDIEGKYAAYVGYSIAIKNIQSLLFVGVHFFSFIINYRSIVEKECTVRILEL